MKKILFFISGFIICFLLSLYLFLVFILPFIVNSSSFLIKAENKISSFFNINTNMTDVRLNVSPLLSFKLQIGEFSLDKNSKILLNLKSTEAKFNIFNFSDGLIKTDYAYIDYVKLKEFMPVKQKSSKINFDYFSLPDLFVNNLEIKYSLLPEIDISSENFLIREISNNQKEISFKSKIITNLFSEPVMVLNNKNIILKSDVIVLDNLDFLIGSSIIHLNGTFNTRNKTKDFVVSGENLKADEVAKSVLLLQKTKEPGKKFIENFVDFRGLIDFKLSFKDNKLNGKVTAKNLSANSVLFNVPIFFKNPSFAITNNTMTSDATGTLGPEEVVHRLLITDITTSKRVVTGEVSGRLTHNLVKKYMPQIYNLKGDAIISVVYKIRNKKPDVTYRLNLPKGSDFYYKNAYLGREDSERELFVHTLKDKNILYLKDYNYSIFNNDIAEKILYGDGYWLKENGKMKFKRISCKTNGYAPVSVTGSFGRYVKGGEFTGNLVYDVERNLITGKFEVIDTIFNDFYVKSAVVDANEKNFNIFAYGKYNRENFKCSVLAENDFKSKIIVKNMSLIFDKFRIAMKKKKTIETHFSATETRSKVEEVSQKIRKIDIDIEHWHIQTGKLLIRNALINDFQVFGNLKNSIFNFEIPRFNFANGILDGNGHYDFRDNSSEININAKNINSNLAATQLFNLNGHITGIANAFLNAKTFDNLQAIQAQAEFEIKKGFLPKIANKEFHKKNNKTFKLSDYTNVDLTRSEVFASNLKGKFFLDDTRLHNIELTTQNKSFASFVEAEYEINSCIGDMKLYGKFDKNSPKRVKIMHIPLSWVLFFALFKNDELTKYQKQINKIPQTETPQQDLKYFFINVNGDFKNNDVEVITRELI